MTCPTKDHRRILVADLGLLVERDSKAGGLDHQPGDARAASGPEALVIWIWTRLDSHQAHRPYPQACVVDRRTVGIVWFLAKQIFSLLQRSIEPCGQSGRSAHCVPLHMVWQP